MNECLTWEDSVTSDSEKDERSPPEQLLLANLDSADSIETVYREIIGVVRTFLKAARCAVAVQQKNRLVDTESWETRPELETATYTLLTSHPGITLEDKQSYRFDDVTATSSGSELIGQSARSRSMLCVTFDGDSTIIVESLTHNASTKAEYPISCDSTRLGVKIVNRIVETHDWKINVTDNEKGSARFEISFQG